MPYCIKVKDLNFDVLNRHYEVIFRGQFPQKTDVSKFLQSLAADRPDWLRNDCCYLYDDRTSPVECSKFSQKLLDEYNHRFMLLLNLLWGIKCDGSIYQELRPL